MTREEQIIQAAKQEEKKIGFAQIVKETKGVNSAYGIGFLEGAKWADEHIIGFENLFEKCVQYPSVKAGIQAHAETYSFNIESELFNQLTKEQQALWRKEIEQACISGGEAGVEFARDPRYKENIKVKEVELVNEADLEYLVKDFCYEFDDRKDKWYEMTPHDKNIMTNPTWSNFAMQLAKYFFELGLKVQKGE